MPKLSLSEQLDRVVQAILAPAAGERQRDGDGLDPKVAPLARIAEQLRGLPREDFRARLKAEFEGSATMASKPAVASEQSTAVTTQQEKKSGSSESYIPAGYKTITPYLTVPNAPELIDFIKQAFGAEETFRTTGTAGGVHCELRLGNSMLMVGGGLPGKAWSGVASPTTLHVYTQDCDATYVRALQAGATSIGEPSDQPYGERLASVKDASGNIWRICFPTYLGQKPYEPDSVQSVQVYLHVNEAASLINFLERAFGAEEMAGRATSPEGLIWHSTIKIGNSQMEMSDAMGPYQPMPSTFYLYVENADAWYRRALHAGASSVKQPVDQPYGDRVGAVQDPAGNLWYLSTHLGAPQAKAPEASAENSAATVKYIREGFHTLTPYLLAAHAARLIDFFKEGFGAQELFRVPQPGGKIMHAELRIGDSMLELSDGTAEFPPRSTMHILHVDDVDAAYERAIRAGATSLNAPTEQPYGDREAGVMDPDGNHWYITERRQTGHSTPDTRTILPGLSMRGAAQFIEFAKQAFGAEEAFMHKSPSGTVIHSRIRIGDSILAVGELRGEFAPMPFHMHMYVPNIDAIYESALRAGAKTLRAPRDEPYGDRAATVEDAFGNYWSFATHIKDVHF
jgi:PhnB protein